MVTKQTEAELHARLDTLRQAIRERINEIRRSSIWDMKNRALRDAFDKALQLRAPPSTGLSDRTKRKLQELHQRAEAAKALERFYSEAFESVSRALQHASEQARTTATIAEDVKGLLMANSMRERKQRPKQHQ